MAEELARYGGAHVYAVQSFTIRNTSITLVSGDITSISGLDALVSSDDTDISMGGGVSRAILRAAGQEVQKEAQRQLPKRVGDVIVTGGGRLTPRHIFHAISLDWHTYTMPSLESVRDLTARCLREAEQLGCRSIAFPSIGTGSGGLERPHAAQAMLAAICDHALRATAPLERIYVDVISPSRSGLRSFLAEFIRAELNRDFEDRYQGLEEKIAALEAEKAQLAARLEHENEETEKGDSSWNLTKDLPHPLAYAYGLSLTPLNWQARAKACFDAFEALARCLAIVAMAAQVDAGTRHIGEWLSDWTKPRGFGQWVELARESVKQVSASGGSPFLTVTGGDFKSAKSSIRQLLSLLDTAPGQRNLLAHGVVKPEAECRQIADEWMPKLEESLTLLKVVMPHPWFVVVQHEFDHNGNSIYTLAEAVGESSLFRKRTVVSDLRLPSGAMVVRCGDTGRMMRLSPFVAHQMCPECHLDDTFLLETAADENHVVYVSYRAGHKVTLAIPGVLNGA